MNIVKRQHYVWRHYLLQWCVNQMVYCKRDGKIFKSNLMGVAQERYFYEIETLTDNELKLLRLMTKHPHRTDYQDLTNGFMDIFSFPSYFERMLKKANISSPEALDILRDIKVNSHEKLHGMIEADSMDILSKLQQSDTAFMSYDEQRFKLIQYLSFQFLRTKKQKKAFDSSKFPVPPDEVGDVDYAKLWGAMTVFTAMHSALGIYAYPKRYYLKILENKTVVRFITGDQPVINLLASHSPAVETKKMEFYHPVSPSVAVVLTNNIADNCKTEIKDENSVRIYNKLMIKNSLEQIYMSNEDDL